MFGIYIFFIKQASIGFYISCNFVHSVWCSGLNLLAIDSLWWDHSVYILIKKMTFTNLDTPFTLATDW